jgi:hypothetical protein
MFWLIERFLIQAGPCRYSAPCVCPSTVACSQTFSPAWSRPLQVSNNILVQQSSALRHSLPFGRDHCRFLKHSLRHSLPPGRDHCRFLITFSQTFSPAWSRPLQVSHNILSDILSRLVETIAGYS